MDRLSQAMNRFFDADDARAHVTWSPAIDVTEDKEKIVLTADVPGLAQKDLDLQIEKDVLTLKGARTIDRAGERKEDVFHRYERVSGQFVRSFTLPPTVDADRVTAQLKDGVLTLVLPKKPEAQPKKIGISIQ
jgi:HSP20 family protein